MTSKERFIAALKCQKPDMVPVAPDVSNMIPCKATGKPFWEIYLYGDPPLWWAYLEILKKFKFDGGWEAGPGIVVQHKNDLREFRRETVDKSADKIVVRDYVKTPEGTLWQETIYWRDMPPVIATKMVKNINDFKLYIKYFFPEPISCDDKEFQSWRVAVGDLGVVPLFVWYPGFQSLFEVFDDFSAMIYNYYEYREIFEQYREIAHEYIMHLLDLSIKCKPDIIHIGASGTLTLASPKIFCEMGLPTLKEITKVCKQHNIPTLLHSCGKARELVKICAEQTDLCGINPLETPPMGDCDLAELKKSYGKKICLMGNLHTTNIMLKGTKEEVISAAKIAIDAAGADGGFILSTGDQCPRDTPEENIWALIETARTYGKYI